MLFVFLMGLLIVLSGTLAMTLHKMDYRPVVYEIVFWSLTLALFLGFEVMLHFR